MYRTYKSRFGDCNFLFNEKKERERDGSNQLALSTDASKDACGIPNLLKSRNPVSYEYAPTSRRHSDFNPIVEGRVSKGAREFLSSGGTRRLNFRFSRIAANSSPSPLVEPRPRESPPSICAIPIARVTLNLQPSLFSPPSLLHHRRCLAPSVRRGAFKSTA